MVTDSRGVCQDPTALVRQVLHKRLCDTEIQVSGSPGCSRPRTGDKPVISANIQGYIMMTRQGYATIVNFMTPWIGVIEQGCGHIGHKWKLF